MSRLRQTLVVPGAVPLNAAGGVLVSASDIDAAVRFLDTSGKGKITMAALRQKLQAFFPGTLPIIFLLTFCMMDHPNFAIPRMLFFRYANVRAEVSSW